MDASEKIDQLIAGITDWRGKTFAAVRKAMCEADREIIEEWKWMGSPVWSRDGLIAVANAHKGKVKLTFAYGAKFADPDKLFNAGLEGNERRAIDFLEGDKVNAPALKKLVRAAIEYNQERSAKKAPGKAAAKPAAKAASKSATKAAAKPAAKKAAATKAPAAAKPAAKKAAADKSPRLLSGGNPQIAKGDGDAPVQAYIAAMPGWKRELGARLDALIVRALPKVQKAIKWNSPLYGSPGQGYFLGIHVYARYVKVTFFQGAALKPLPPGVSKSAEVRHFDIKEGDVLDEAQFIKWVKQAAKLPGFLG